MPFDKKYRHDRHREEFVRLFSLCKAVLQQWDHRVFEKDFQTKFSSRIQQKSLPVVVQIDNAERRTEIFAHLRSVENSNWCFIEITVDDFNGTTIIVQFRNTNNDFYSKQKKKTFSSNIRPIERTLIFVVVEISNGQRVTWEQRKTNRFFNVSFVEISPR